MAPISSQAYFAPAEDGTDSDRLMSVASFPHAEPVFSEVVWKGIRRNYVLGPVMVSAAPKYTWASLI